MHKSIKEIILPCVEKTAHQFSTSYLAELIIPLIFESLLGMMIGMADTIMVSRVGEAAVSAVSLVDSISVLLVQLFTAFSTGGAVIVSQYLGRKDKENAIGASRNLIYISSLIAAVIALFMLAFKDSVIDIVFGSISEDVRGYTSDYFTPILLSYPALAFFESLTAISRSEGKTARTMAASVIMNAINIFGNAALIYVFNLGPLGAGISSLTSRIIGCLFMFSLMYRKTEELSLIGLTKGPLSYSMIKRILRIAIPAGIESTLFHVGKILVQSLIATLGTAQIAINAVVMNFNSYSNIPGNGINLALITIVGQCRGKENFKDIKYYTRLLMLLVYASTLLITVPLYIFTPEVVALYGLESASIAEAVPIARGCLIACLIIWPFAFTLPNTLKATGDVKFIMAVSLLSMWLFRVSLAYVLIKFFSLKVDGVWYAMYVDWLVRGALYYARYKSGRWKSLKVI